MFTVVIYEKEGAERRLSFSEPEVTVGRVPGNDVVLPKGNVSKRHSRIVLKDNRFIVVDLKSTNGTYVNGRKITSPVVVKEGDKVYVGDFILTLESGASLDAPTSAPPPPDEAAEGPSAESLPPVLGNGASIPPPLPSSPALRATAADFPAALDSQAGAADEAIELEPDDELKEEEAGASVPPVLAAASLPKPDDAGPAAPESIPAADSIPAPPTGLSAAPKPAPAPSAAPPARASAQARSTPAARLLQRVLRGYVSVGEAAKQSHSELAGAVGRALDELETQPERERSRLERAALSELSGLGPVDRLLEDRGVHHVVVERFDTLYVDRGNGLEVSEERFSCPEALAFLVERLASLAPPGALEHGAFEHSTPQGLHFSGVLAHAANDGPLLAVHRRPAADRLAQSELAEPVVDVIADTLASRKNVWVVGDSAGTLTRFVSAIVAQLPSSERLLLLEPYPELTVGVRPAVALKLGAAPLESVLARAAAFSVTRVVVHRGSDAGAALTAVARGAPGGILSSEHANVDSAWEAVTRTVDSQLLDRTLGLVIEVCSADASEAEVARLFKVKLDATGAAGLREITPADAGSGKRLSAEA